MVSRTPASVSLGLVGGVAIRKVAPLGLAAVAGFGLAACGGGGGGALSTLTGAIGTRTSGLTLTATTAITTTVQTTVAPPPTGETSSSGTPWGWIALGVGLGLAALAVGLWALHRRRSGAETWGARTADLNRRTLVALDAVVAQGSIVTGQVEALASEARSLESRAPDDPSRAAAANVRARLDELASTLETDRALRLGSPPPNEEQLAYSTALIRQQVDQLQGALRQPGGV
jgi:hypothetical protein